VVALDLHSCDWLRIGTAGQGWRAARSSRFLHGRARKLISKPPASAEETSRPNRGGSPLDRAVTPAMIDSMKLRHGGGVCMPVDQPGTNEISTMPSKIPPIGPMPTQPGERASIMPTQVQPMMPAIGRVHEPQPKQRPRGTEAVRVAEAEVTRLNSLRRQREAQKG
jgi:hypothetical protein